MIKFVPELIALQKDQIGNEMIVLRNESVYNNAEELNRKYAGVHCKTHSDKESTILVKLHDVEDFLEIKDWCCEDFRSELFRIVQAETRG